MELKKIRKIVSLALAASLLLALAACGNKKDEGNTYTVPAKTYAWPDDALFSDVPALKEKVNTYVSNKSDKGTTFKFGVTDMSYGDFRKYILSLEEAGFSIYDAAGLGTASTAKALPETLEEGKVSASWVGFRRGLYIAAFWYADEFYTQNNLPKDDNVKLTFYTYNPFK